jgi:hypothetical protein
MARYMVERTFPDKLVIPTNDEGANICLTVAGVCRAQSVEKLSIFNGRMTFMWAI